MFVLAYIPGNAQPASKHGVFTDVPALASRTYAIYTHAPEFCTRQSVFKKSFILNNPVVTRFIFSVSFLFWLDRF